MVAYWMLFALPAFFSIYERPDRSFRGEELIFLLSMVLVAIMIGARFEVGGDWSSYLKYITAARYLPIWDLLQNGDPGYIALNWVAVNLGGGILLVNIICGLLFAFGLFVFARAQPNVWLTFLVAVPYLIIVVAMGYSRQGVAIGFAMVAFVALTRKQSTLRFLLWILLAAAFHKSAILLAPIAGLVVDRGRFWNIFWILLATLAGYYLLIENSLDGLLQNYIETEYQSEGALVRIAMNGLPATIFIIFRDRFSMGAVEKRFYLILSLVSLSCFPLLSFIPSTAIDRMALYIIPLQLVVFSRMPIVFSGGGGMTRLITFGVIVYAAAVQYIWLSFAPNAASWLPYRSYLI